MFYLYAIPFRDVAHSVLSVVSGVQIKVFIQLYRPSDESYSEPVEFRYKPAHGVGNARKRPRIGSAFNSAEIPATVDERNFYDESRQPQCTISAEFDTQKIIQSVLLSAADSTTTQMPQAPTQPEQYNSFPMLSGNLNSAGTARFAFRSRSFSHCFFSESLFCRIGRHI